MPDLAVAVLVGMLSVGLILQALALYLHLLEHTALSACCRRRPEGDR